MRKLFYYLTIITSIFLFIGCQSAEEKVCLEEGLTYIDSKEYSNALSKFNEGLESNPKNSKLTELKDITENYIKANDSYSAHEFEDANKFLNNIKTEYNEYSIAEDIDLLKSKVATMINRKNILDTAIEKLKKLNVNNYNVKLNENSTYIAWYSDGEPMDITHLSAGVDTTQYPYSSSISVGWNKDLKDIEKPLKEVLNILQLDNKDEVYNLLTEYASSYLQEDLKVTRGNTIMQLRSAQGGIIAKIDFYSEEDEVNSTIEKYNNEKESTEKEQENIPIVQEDIPIIEEDTSIVQEKINTLDQLILIDDIVNAENLVKEIDGMDIPEILKPQFETLKAKLTKNKIIIENQLAQSTTPKNELTIEESFNILKNKMVDNEAIKYSFEGEEIINSIKLYKFRRFEDSELKATGLGFYSVNSANGIVKDLTRNEIIE